MDPPALERALVKVLAKKGRLKLDKACTKVVAKLSTKHEGVDADAVCAAIKKLISTSEKVQQDGKFVQLPHGARGQEDGGGASQPTGPAAATQEAAQERKQQQREERAARASGEQLAVPSQVQARGDGAGPSQRQPQRQQKEQRRQQQEQHNEQQQRQEQQPQSEGPAPTAAPAGAKRKRKAKIPGAPKRAISAFIAFSNAKRPELAAQHPGEAVPQLSRRLGEMWRALPAADKAPFEERAAEGKARYAKEMEEWRARGGEDAVEAAAAGEGSGQDAAAGAAGGGAAARQPKRARREGSSGVPEDGGIQRGLTWRQDYLRTDVKHGRFSDEEKAALRGSAASYARANGLDAEDLSWLADVRGSGKKGAMSEIVAALPNRTRKASWACLLRLLAEGRGQGKWTAEEDEKLRQQVADRGTKWKEVAAALARPPDSCRDRWRAISIGPVNKGRWTQEETDKLKELVEGYMAAAGELAGSSGRSLTSGYGVSLQGRSAGRVVADDVDWEAIARQMGSRNHTQCMDKWYSQVAPSMVDAGLWDPRDDKRLLKALLECGVEHEGLVDWEGLLPGRAAAQVRRRWHLMTKMVPDAVNKGLEGCAVHLAAENAPKLLRGRGGGDSAGRGDAAGASGSGTGGQHQQEEAQEARPAAAGEEGEGEPAPRAQRAKHSKRQRAPAAEAAAQQQPPQQQHQQVEAQPASPAAAAPAGKAAKRRHKPATVEPAGAGQQGAGEEEQQQPTAPSEVQQLPPGMRKKDKHQQKTEQPPPQPHSSAATPSKKAKRKHKHAEARQWRHQ